MRFPQTPRPHSDADYISSLFSFLFFFWLLRSIEFINANNNYTVFVPVELYVAVPTFTPTIRPLPVPSLHLYAFLLRLHNTPLYQPPSLIVQFTHISNFYSFPPPSLPLSFPSSVEPLNPLLFVSNSQILLFFFFRSFLSLSVHSPGRVHVVGSSFR